MRARRHTIATDTLVADQLGGAYRNQPPAFLTEEDQQQPQQTKAQAMTACHALISEIRTYMRLHRKNPLVGLSESVCIEAKLLLDHPRKYHVHHPDVDNIHLSLTYTLKLLKNNKDTATAHKLKQHAKDQAHGKPHFWKKFSGILLLIVGSVLIGLAAVAIPFTGGLSGIAIAGGVGMFASGIGLIQRGARKGLSRELDTLAKRAQKISRT